MISLSLNMKFWDDGQPYSTRIRNVIYSWNQLKSLTKILKENELNVDCFLYDFSPKKIIEDSIHISYPIGVYKKAEKTNIILKKSLNYNFFMMVDCDAFFDVSDYDKLIDLLHSLVEGDVCTFDLAKLENNVDEYIINGEFYKEKSNWSFAYSGDRKNPPLNGVFGGLGGVYICDTNLLNSLGGFDEKYEGWGGEDGDMLDRIWYSNIKHQIRPIRNFFPFHLPHFTDWGNEKYYKR